MKPEILYHKRPPVVRAIGDCAEQLGLSTGALASAIKRGEIPLEIVVFGRRRFIRSVEFDSFIQQQKAKR